ncbi:hypothetical protein ACFVAJ_05450 [Agromyces sp. NPDC057679]|uniref:hypothetical protein n=1 Tax=Agromyces sp. NPDC057679 TaxID=3346207 RepID=UPI00366C2EB6
MHDPNVDPTAGEQRATTTAPPSRRRAPLGTLAVIAVIGLQVTVPLIALLQPPPQKLGFQMYSALGGVTAFTIDAEGAEHRVDDLERIVAKNRPEIDWLPSLPEAICAAESAAVSVRVEQSGRSRSLTCD